MSFATLEEAWGLASFEVAPPPRGLPEPRGPPEQQQHHRRPRAPAQPAQPAQPAEPRRFALAAPAPQGYDKDDGEDTQPTRRVLARTYARFGLEGVLRLMPREALQQLNRVAAARGGGGGGAGSRLWDDFVAFVSCPEKMLLLLLCAFALLVVWDGLQADHAANAAASLASLHMAPFPTATALGGGGGGGLM